MLSGPRWLDQEDRVGHGTRPGWHSTTLIKGETGLLVDLHTVGAARGALTVGARCGYDRTLVGDDVCLGGVHSYRGRRQRVHPEVARSERTVLNLLATNPAGRDRTLADCASSDVSSLDRARSDVSDGAPEWAAR
jgi:hypothetical protein